VPISIRDVAASAGVSLGTVSKVLNERAGAQIAPETRERVRRAARELGYHPSAVARALVRKQMDTLGLVLPPGSTSPIRAPFFSALVDGIFQAAAERRQNITVFTGHRWRNAQESLPYYRDGRCDGLLLCFQLPESDIVTALLDARIPMVTLNDIHDDPRATTVDVDNIAGAREMTAYLLSIGHRNIGLICGLASLNFVAPRIEGYKRALSAAGVPFDPALVAAGESTRRSIAEQVDTLLTLPIARRPTALFCLSDGLATDTFIALAARGVRIPQEISVAGFNDDGSASWHEPPLTTMRQPFVDLGERAIDLLIERIKDPSLPAVVEFLKTELVVRGSTAPPAVTR
jgi:DNA-binding LacI/PurR family transcriptional regulator